MALRRAAITLAACLSLAVPATAAGDQWFKTDTHVHSVVSGDGLPDLGIISSAGKARGFNAMFITDHQAGSNFPISTVIANHVVFTTISAPRGTRTSSARPRSTSPSWPPRRSGAV